MENISFHAHHSPWGAYSSFILGRLGKGGGFVLNDVKPPGNDVYVGFQRRGQRVPSASKNARPAIGGLASSFCTNKRSPVPTRPLRTAGVVKVLRSRSTLHENLGWSTHISSAITTL